MSSSEPTNELQDNSTTTYHNFSEEERKELREEMAELWEIGAIQPLPGNERVMPLPPEPKPNPPSED